MSSLSDIYQLFLFFLHFLNTLPCWYAKSIMFFWSVLIISFYSFIMSIASSQLSIIFARSFKSFVPMFSLQTSDSINRFLISSLLSLLRDCLMPLESFLNYKKCKRKLNLCKKQVFDLKSKLFDIHKLDLPFDIHKLSLP